VRSPERMVYLVYQERGEQDCRSGALGSSPTPDRCEVDGQRESGRCESDRLHKAW
jgi:hypothetical protein